MTFSFIRSDNPVYTTVSFRPFSPSHPTQAIAGPIVSYVRNAYRTFSGRVHDFHNASTQGWGTHMEDFQIAGVWTRSECKLHINVLELKVILTLQHWVAVLQGHHVLIATANTTVVAYVAAGSRSVSVATDSGHNSASQTHSRLPQYYSRLVISAESAHHSRVESPPRSRESDILSVGNSSSGHICHSPQHASSPVYVSSSGASSTGDHRTGRGGQCTCLHHFPCSTKSF